MAVPLRLSWAWGHKPLPTIFRHFHRKFNLKASTSSDDLISLSLPQNSPFSGLEDELLSFISGKKRATEVAHSVWRRVVQEGDTVIDTTCGNGHDTLAMLKMVADESGKGSVYGMDIQEVALQKTSSLLEESVSLKEKELVKLFSKCHSKMREILPPDTCVRLVAFNLGYLPGGDKTIITESGTTLKALEIAKDILLPGGLISLVVYVGHPGGCTMSLLPENGNANCFWSVLERKPLTLDKVTDYYLKKNKRYKNNVHKEELQIVRHFVSRLSVEKWICCEYQSSNRSMSPILVFLFKRC